MPQALVGTGGFLAAVLWMDLMFDFQALNHAGVLPAEVLASVAAYYYHVTTGAAPMGSVVSLVMLLTVVGAVVQLSKPAIPLWVRAGVLVTALVPTLLALAVIVPAATRLGAQADPPALQTELVRDVLRGHLVCLGSVLVYLALQIFASRKASHSPR